MRLVPYGGDSGGLLMGLEAALVVMVCLYVVVDLWALTFAVRRGWEWGGFRGVKHELKQLLRGWTLYGWLLIAMFWAVYGLRKAVTAEMDALNGLRPLSLEVYYPTQHITAAAAVATYVTSATALLVYVKTFKYLAHWPYVSTLSLTLGTAWRDLLAFVLIFTITIIGFPAFLRSHNIYS